MMPHRKNARSLLTRRGRREHREVLVEGARFVGDALESGAVVTRIYHTATEPGDRVAGLVGRAIELGIEVALVDVDELAEISDTEAPQGVVAVARCPDWQQSALTSETGDIVILDAVRDPGNVGAIMRTAAAAGARALIAARGTVELENPKVLRASMGAYFRLPTFVAPSIDNLRAIVEIPALPLFVADSAGGVAAAGLPREHDVALVLGGEAAGAQADWSSLGAETVHIPMPGAAESLNVAAAAAILLFRRTWSL